MANPFTPNFGQVPTTMGGRDVLIEEILYGLENAPGDPSLTSLLIGARGTGKTALLSYLSNEASQRGWVVANVSSLPGMLEDVIQRATEGSRHIVGSSAKVHLKGVSIAQFASVEWQIEATETPNWRTRMNNLLDELAEHEIGLFITVDEVDPTLDEMIQLAAVHQHFIRENRKVALVMAGLPHKALGLVNEKSVSFLRRASQFHLDPIAEHDSRLVFKTTVESSGKTINEKALDLAARECGGFPYMLQLIGYRSWQTSGDCERITISNVNQGLDLARKDMEARVLRPTLDELSDGDLLFLEAMLPDENVTAIANVEKRMGKSSGYISRYRSRLIEHGVIAPHSRGKIAFALPTLREYLPAYLEMRL